MNKETLAARLEVQVEITHKPWDSGKSVTGNRAYNNCITRGAPGAPNSPPPRTAAGAHGACQLLC